MHSIMVKGGPERTLPRLQKGINNSAKALEVQGIEGQGPPLDDGVHQGGYQGARQMALAFLRCQSAGKCRALLIGLAINKSSPRRPCKRKVPGLGTLSHIIGKDYRNWNV